MIYLPRFYLFFLLIYTFSLRAEKNSDFEYLVSVKNYIEDNDKYKSSKSEWVKAVLGDNLEKNNLSFHFSKIQSKNSAFLTEKFHKELDQISGSELTANNSFQMLYNGQSFAKKMELIKGAKNSIYISYLQIVCDQAGLEMFRALDDAVLRGVDVKVLLNGDLTYSKYQLATLEGSCAALSDTRYFTKKLFGKEMELLNLRPNVFYTSQGKLYSLSRGLTGQKGTWLHDKIMVVDLKYGITGGQNVSSGWANSNGKDENFRDTDILVQGPVVYQMAQRIIDLFVKDENGDFKNQSQMDVYRKLVSKKINESRAMGLSGARNYEKWFRENRQGLCRFVGQNPRLNSFEVLESYKHYVRHANNYIYAEIPQVDMLDKDDKIRTELLLDMLGAKKQRGVQIHILTNGNGFVDSTILPSSGPFNILKSMQESFGYNPLGKKTAISTAKALFDSVNMSGFNIYIYPHWTHGKIWNFDGIAASIGSFNFDSSATTWTESVLLCQDENLMSELIEEQQGLIRYSSKMETPNIVPKQKDLKK